MCVSVFVCVREIDYMGSARGAPSSSQQNNRLAASLLWTPVLLDWHLDLTNRRTDPNPALLLGVLFRSSPLHQPIKELLLLQRLIQTYEQAP